MKTNDRTPYNLQRVGGNRAKYKCLLCGRKKFIRKEAHYCVGGYRKHKIKWKRINNDE